MFLLSGTTAQSCALALGQRLKGASRNRISSRYKTAYFGTIFVGLPRPQKFTVRHQACELHFTRIRQFREVVFDTGSGHFIVPSKKCEAALTACFVEWFCLHSLTQMPACANHTAYAGSRESAARFRWDALRKLRIAACRLLRSTLTTMATLFPQIPSETRPDPMLDARLSDDGSARLP